MKKQSVRLPKAYSVEVRIPDEMYRDFKLIYKHGDFSEIMRLINEDLPEDQHIGSHRVARLFERNLGEARVMKGIIDFFIAKQKAQRQETEKLATA